MISVFKPLHHPGELSYHSSGTELGIFYKGKILLKALCFRIEKNWAENTVCILSLSGKQVRYLAITFFRIKVVCVLFTHFLHKYFEVPVKQDNCFFYSSWISPYVWNKSLQQQGMTAWQPSRLLMGVTACKSEIMAVHLYEQQFVLSWITRKSRKSEKVGGEDESNRNIFR